jgi:hypothetical protein
MTDTVPDKLTAGEWKRRFIAHTVDVLLTNPEITDDWSPEQALDAAEGECEAVTSDDGYMDFSPEECANMCLGFWEPDGSAMKEQT